jgi:PleD family two-component response regulator
MTKAHSKPTAPDTILIVDDKLENLKVLSAVLFQNHYKVRKATSGEFALKSVQMSPPNLILLDIQMPGMNGYDVCQELKASVATQDIPIIFISALDDVLIKVQAFELGGLTILQNLLRRRKYSHGLKPSLPLHDNTKN